MNGKFYAAVPLLGVVVWLAAFAQERPEQEIMWRKLDLSHQILDALVLEDFEALEAYVEDLDGLAVSGVYNILDTEQYREQSQLFREAIRALGEATRDRNAEAGALAYVDLTLRCVRCHQSFGVEPR